MFADEHRSYDDLVALNPLRRVNHATAYRAEDGANTNQVEIYFARVRIDPTSANTTVSQ